MTGVIGYARTMFHGGRFMPPELPTFADEIMRFHETLAGLRADLADESLTARISDRQFLQGPLSDAMTHAGQLAMLRRLDGSPVPSENFIFAKIDAENVTAEQPDPEAPDEWWRPETPPLPPGTHASRSPTISVPAATSSRSSPWQPRPWLYPNATFRPTFRPTFGPHGRPALSWTLSSLSAWYPEPANGLRRPVRRICLARRGERNAHPLRWARVAPDFLAS